mmetsp:Transcript_4246/g.10894  ORF Transcript_4246/g.10894 Transcript_4246/m.10894 type:complete len:206 (+) Transcript_4246:1584-2201(+)
MDAGYASKQELDGGAGVLHRRIGSRDGSRGGPAQCSLAGGQVAASRRRQGGREERARSTRGHLPSVQGQILVLGADRHIHPPHAHGHALLDGIVCAAARLCWLCHLPRRALGRDDRAALLPKAGGVDQLLRLLLPGGGAGVWPERQHDRRGADAVVHHRQPPGDPRSQRPLFPHALHRLVRGPASAPQRLCRPQQLPGHWDSLLA